MQYFNDHATSLRVTFFFIGLLLFGLAGLWFPYRAFDRSRDLFRWINNLSLVSLNGFTTYLLVPFSLVYLANHYSHAHTLFGASSNSSSVLAQVIFLDLVIYWQHYLFHRIAPLWRLHRVHHSDTEFDSTTALRFHTLEIYLSFFIKALAVWSFGISPVAIVIFEIILNFSAMFSHGNFSLPRLFEKINLLVVTPDMHRIHHSIDTKECNSNFGFCLSVWDRIFKTYRKQSNHDLKLGKIGMLQFRERQDQSLLGLLKQPFRQS